MQHLAHRQWCKQVHDHLKEQLVGAGVPGEGTHFRDSHIIVHMFILMLPVGGVEDLVTRVTTQSCKKDLCIEKERP